jgi:hypothetical protein
MEEMAELLDPHATVTDLFSTLQKRGQNPYDTRIMTILRNPFAHALSIYQFWRSDILTDEEKELAYVKITRRLSFPEFLKNLIVEDPFARALLVDNRIPRNVNIIKLETFVTDTHRILNEQLQLNVDVNLPHYNATKHGPVMGYYDQESRALIRRVYQWCFDQGFYD